MGLLGFFALSFVKKSIIVLNTKDNGVLFVCMRLHADGQGAFSFGMFYEGVDKNEKDKYSNYSDIHVYGNRSSSGTGCRWSAGKN
jgi:hypothetical protein